MPHPDAFPGSSAAAGLEATQPARLWSAVHCSQSPPCRRSTPPCEQTLEAEKEAALAAELQRPEFGPGDVIELKLSVPENKRRVTVFKGICIAKRNRRCGRPHALGSPAPPPAQGSSGMSDFSCLRPGHMLARLQWQGGP